MSPVVQMKTDLQEPEEYFLIGQDEKRMAIYMRYQLFKALEDFAKREQREQVGLLVGRVSESGFLLVEDAIESPVGDESTGRFEESLWKRARRIAAARHPNRAVVGWFHTQAEGSLEPVEEEKIVHKRFFPEAEHILYKIGSRGQDRNFFLRHNEELVAAEGFRIYGKAPANSGEAEEIVPVSGRSTVNAVSATADQHVRQIERNVEKIQKRLQDPPMAWKDYLILALLVVNAMLILFRPNPPVTVDNTKLERGQSDLSAQVTSVRGRIDRLERHLGELSLLDEQLKLAAGSEEIDGLTDDPNMEELVEPAPPIVAGEANKLAGGAGVVKLYKVKEGDILGVLVEKFYPDGADGTLKSFSRFNRLKGDSIFPGDTLKVPPAEALRS